MPRRNPPRFRKTLLALAAGAALAPHSAWALDLATAPPGTVMPYVAPNVILSLDDSGSMDEKDMLNNTTSRAQVLRDALKEVFSDKDLLPDKKIRMAWQTLGDCTQVNNVRWAPKLGTAAASSSNINVMRSLEGTHRANFLKYAAAFTTCSYTPTHFMMRPADEYMRAPLHQNGPWASKPGETLNGANGKPLGCRRNYHIVLTDGAWNGTYYGPESTYFDHDKDNSNGGVQKNNSAANREDINTNPVNFDNQDSETNSNGKLGPNYPVETTTAFFLPDGTAYKRSDPQTWVYRDIDYPTWSSFHVGYRPCSETKIVKKDGNSWVTCTNRWGGYMSTLSDWSFQSWAKPLQNKNNLDGSISPLPEYDKAPAEETFTNRVSKRQATLKKYWNPRYNPATWPHMTTFTIGFSTDSLPKNQYRPMGDNSTWQSNIGKYSVNKLWEKPGPNIDTTNGNSGKLVAPSSTLPYGYDGSFADFASGKAQWHAIPRQEQDDMWHAAINGRGQFYAVEKGEDLKEAFRQIVKTINANVEPDMTSTATSGSNVSRNEVGKFTGNYEPKNGWKGSVTADRVKPDGTTAPDIRWEGKTTADRLDAMSVTNRVVLSWSDQWVDTKPKGGVPFQWASDDSNLSTAQKLWLQKNTAGTDEGTTKGQQRLNYIRGDRSLEGSESTGYTTAKPYRERKSRQGDIINSDVWYTGAPAGNSLLKGYAAFVRDHKARPAMLYVGGNDGMLHGFTASKGEEKLAYVPRGVVPKLPLLTAPAYNAGHQYFVDGSPMTGDVDMNGGMQDPKAGGYDDYVPDWRTLLVGTLGLGGKGYFVLDVTNPTATTAPSGSAPAFTEANAASLVKLDRTRGSTATEPVPDCAAMTVAAEKTACLEAVEEDKDIGYITAKPVLDENNAMRSTQITRLNNNRWAVVMGNGYNSTNQRAVLLIQYLDGDKKLVRIPTAGTVAAPPTPGTGLANDNGLSAPRVIDLDGDGLSDVVYAGDNLGNLWKFDLTSASASDWGVAFSGKPLFTASGLEAPTSASRDQIQPITAPPMVRANDRTKIVGSGEDAKTVKVGGMMVAFGTGRNVEARDPNQRSVQTLYSVLDNTRYRYRNPAPGLGKRLEVHPGGGSCPSGDNCVPEPTPLGAGASAAKLAQQEFAEIDSGTYGAIKPTNASNELKPENWGNFNGWYVDLPATGERLLKGMEFYDASNLLTVWSQVPAKGSTASADVESCDATSVDEEHQYRTFVNIMDGKAPSVALVDKNKDGKFNVADGDGYSVGSGKYISISRKKVEKGPHSIIGIGKYENVDIDAKNNKEKLARMPEESLRPSWRQIQ